MKKIELTQIEKGIVIASFFIMVLAGSLFASTLLAVESSPILYEAEMNLSQAFDTVLEVTVTDKDGVVKDSRLKVGDLVLTNFAEVLRIVISDAEISGASLSTTSSYFKTEAAVAKATVVKGTQTNPSNYGGLFGSYGSTYPETRLAIGTGANAPNVGDVDLQTEVETKTLITADAVYANGNLTFYGAVACTGSNTITEAGVYKYVMTIGSPYYHLFLRDTFSGISVVNEDTVTLSYTLMLGEGYTDNFGNILEVLFCRYKTVAETISMTDDSGGSFNAYVYGQNTNNWLLDTDAGSDIASMAIGTGTTAPDRSDYDVETQVEGYADASVSPIYENNINYTSIATWQVTDDRMVTEAGFFLKGKDSGGANKYFMIFRDTFSSAAITNGREITVTFKVYYNVG